jgi:hypothetical protein
MCSDNAAPGNPAGARCVCGGRGKGEGKVVEQQIGALGNPCSPFSSSFSLLWFRRGFDKKSRSRQRHTEINFHSLNMSLYFN